MAPPNPIKEDMFLEKYKSVKACPTSSEGTAKSSPSKVVLCDYPLNIVKAIPKEEIKQILDNYYKDKSNL